MTDETDGRARTNGGEPPPPRSVARLDGAESTALASQAAVFDDLQYVLMCCEHLVTALDGPTSGPVKVASDPALVEALWTGALVGYARCFSARAGVLTDQDVQSLDLGEQAMTFHDAVKKLRDHYASRHVNPRETITVGVALKDDGSPNGVAVTSMPNPTVDAATVRLLGRIAYGLSGTVDARMQQAQGAVLDAATAMPRAELQRLPQYEVTR